MNDKMFRPADLLSPLALAGDPPYFHRNADHIVFDFDQGTPDPAVFPVGDLQRLIAEVIATDGPESFDYISHRYGYADLTMGWTPLREQISAFLDKREGRAPDPDGVVVTNGSSQAIALAISAYVTRGDAVFVEAASFPFALRWIAQAGARIFPIAVDDDGLDPDALTAAVADARALGLRPKLIYSTPTYQLPTGTVLSLDRRRRLLEIASEADLLVIEDMIFAQFRYDGDEVPSLYSLDTEGRVLQTDGFTKLVAPGIRIGWVAGGLDVISGVARARQDLGPNQLLSRVMAQYLSEDLWSEQVERSVDKYRPRRDAAAGAFSEHCEGLVDFSPPRGGFYLWLRLLPDLDWQVVRQAAHDRGLACAPGERRLDDPDGSSYVRFAFAHAESGLIDDGVRRFADAIRSADVTR